VLHVLTGEGKGKNLFYLAVAPPFIAQVFYKCNNACSWSVLALTSPLSPPPFARFSLRDWRIDLLSPTITPLSPTLSSSSGTPADTTRPDEGPSNMTPNPSLTGVDHNNNNTSNNSNPTIAVNNNYNNHHHSNPNITASKGITTHGMKRPGKANTLNLALQTSLVQVSWMELVERGGGREGGNIEQNMRMICCGQPTTVNRVTTV